MNRDKSCQPLICLSSTQLQRQAVGRFYLPGPALVQCNSFYTHSNTRQHVRILAVALQNLRLHTLRTRQPRQFRFSAAPRRTEYFTFDIQKVTFTPARNSLLLFKSNYQRVRPDPTNAGMMYPGILLKLLLQILNIHPQKSRLGVPCQQASYFLLGNVGQWRLHSHGIDRSVYDRAIKLRHVDHRNIQIRHKRGVLRHGIGDDAPIVVGQYHCQSQKCQSQQPPWFATLHIISRHLYRGSSGCTLCPNWRKVLRHVSTG